MGIQIRFPSYDTKYGNVGTAHNENCLDGNSFCLGEFEKIIFILGAKRQVTGLIRLMKAYFESCNLKSEFNRPNFEVMRLDKPQVKDDSYEAWKAANPKEAVALTANVGEPEPEDIDEDNDDGDGDGDNF